MSLRVSVKLKYNSMLFAYYPPVSFIYHYFLLFSVFNFYIFINVLPNIFSKQLKIFNDILSFIILNIELAKKFPSSFSFTSFSFSICLTFLLHTLSLVLSLFLSLLCYSLCMKFSVFNIFLFATQVITKTADSYLYVALPMYQ